MPHSAEHPEPWPVIPTSVQYFDVTFSHQVAPEPEHGDILHYGICYQTSLHFSGKRCVLVHPSDLEIQGENYVARNVYVLRLENEVSDLYVLAVARADPDPNPLCFSFSGALQMDPVELSACADTVASAPSNLMSIGAAPAFLPEPGLLVMLVIGALGLAVAGWRRKTR